MKCVVFIVFVKYSMSVSLEWWSKRNHQSGAAHTRWVDSSPSTGSPMGSGARAAGRRPAICGLCRRRVRRRSRVSAPCLAQLPMSYAGPTWRSSSQQRLETWGVHTMADHAGSPFEQNIGAAIATGYLDDAFNDIQIHIGAHRHGRVFRQRLDCTSTLTGCLTA